MKSVIQLSTMCLALLIAGCASFDSRAKEMATADLKLRHAQLLQSLGYDIEVVDLSVLRHPMFGSGDGPPKHEKIEEKEAIERELLRRWKNGDEGAYLEIFESLK